MDRIIVSISQAGWDDKRFREDQQRYWSAKFPDQEVVFKIVPQN